MSSTTTYAAKSYLPGLLITLFTSRTLPSHTALYVFATKLTNGYGILPVVPVTDISWSVARKKKRLIQVRSRVERQFRNSFKNLVWVSKGDGRRRKIRDRWREHLRFVGLLCQLSCFVLQPLHAAGKQIKDAVNISGCVGFHLHSVCSSARRKGFQISSTLQHLLFIFPDWPLIHALWLLPSDSACQCAVVCQAQGYSHPTARPLLYGVFYLERDII